MPAKMKHKINPQVDCVFKSILGSEKNKALLIDFLNSILQPEQIIETVDIINPFNEKEFLSDKLTIVDIKAIDKLKQQYQIEIQIANHAYLPERMLYTWSNIYSSQLESGDNYRELTPVISIWLLAQNLFKETDTYHHHFQLQDSRNQRLLTAHCSLHILELNKWQKGDSLSHADQWLYFFKEAYNWTELPRELNTPTMLQAMETLRMFSEREIEQDRYLRRKLFLLDQNTLRREREILEQEMEEAQQQLKIAQEEVVIAQEEVVIAQEEAVIAKKEATTAQKETAISQKEAVISQKSIQNARQQTKNDGNEIERLSALLKKAGVDF